MRSDMILFPTSECIVLPIVSPLLKDTNWLEEQGIHLPVSNYKDYIYISDKSSFTQAVTEYGLKE